ncbi:hypothetical protein ACQ4PT_022285 [Festuca glaucescens]
MDPSAAEPGPPRAAAGVGAEPAEGSRRRRGTAVRGVLGVAFPIAASFLFSFLVGIAGLALGGLSSSASVSMPSTCRILSTGVDIRSSKICELGLLNYRAKHVFYPSSNRRFRCHDDYYWASVFEVEYTEYFSGQTSYAMAEAPKEALPHNCRPDFGAAWSTTARFKVNESYSCRYTLGSTKADIYPDKLFNCTAEEPSIIEMLKRIFVLFSKSYMSKDFSSGRMLGYVAAGVVAGMLSSLVSTIVLRSFRGVFLAAVRWAVSNHSIRVFAYRFKRACLLVAYVSFVGWITLQYSKMIGLKELLLDYKLMERFSKSYMSKDFNSRWMLGYAAGVVVGMSSLVITIVLRSFRGVFPAAARWAVSNHSIRVFAYRFKRACLLVAYVSFVGWMTLQYSKMIGLKELLLDYELMERFM